ncbi:MAG: SDR family oxidoreductase [Thaumarchaeota archaeon]|nr:SDR family oxidoreductase [Nitrososphaerota archaeon]
MSSASFSLNDELALVTGSASGIGLATAQLFERLGAKVLRADLSYPGGLSENKGTLTFGADLRVAAEVEDLIRHCDEAFHGLHVIVNSAGIEMKGTVLDLSEESFDRVMETNLKSIFLVCKYGIPLLQKTSNRGSIINLSSDLGIQPIPGVDGYAASKGAIIALTKAMSKNWAKSGLRINCIAPGPIDTPLLARFQDPKILDFLKENVLPLGRLGTPDEVAWAIAFLASGASSLINGAVLTANGGLVG